MNLLVNESLQQDLARVLADAVHVADIGLRGDTDNALLSRAVADGRIIITADTDFGTLLALSGAARPSVLLLRRGGRRTVERARIVLTVLRMATDHFEQGAVITVEQDRLRVRELPIER